MGIIFTAIVSVVLSIGSIVIGLLSCVVFEIGVFKKEIQKKKNIIQSLIENILLHQQIGKIKI